MVSDRSFQDEKSTKSEANLSTGAFSDKDGHQCKEKSFQKNYFFFYYNSLKKTVVSDVIRLKHDNITRMPEISKPTCG